MNPIPTPEPVTVPPSWHKQVDKTDRQAASTAWWKAFGDTKLNHLLVLALQANGDIGQASARVLQARAGLAAAQANLRPSLTAGAGVDYVRVPGIELGGTRFAAENAVWPYAGFSADYELDLFGRLAKAAQSAGSEVQASEFDRQQVRLAVIFELVRAYIELRHAQQKLQILEQRSLMADELALLERRRLESGLSTWRFVNEAEISAQDLKIAKVRTERDIELGLARLALLTSRPVEKIQLPIDSTTDSMTVGLSIVPSVPARVIGRRPEVQSAWQLLLASTTDIDRAELERYPNITLSGIVGIASSGFSGWLAKDALGWLVGAAASVPVFDGGRIQATVDQTKAVQAERLAAYRKAVYTALTDVESALIEWQAVLNILETTTKQLALRQQDVTKQEHALELGRSNRLDHLRVQLATLSAREAVDTAIYQRWLAYAAVQKALAN